MTVRKLHISSLRSAKKNNRHYHFKTASKNDGIARTKKLFWTQVKGAMIGESPSTYIASRKIKRDFFGSNRFTLGLVMSPLIGFLIGGGDNASSALSQPDEFTNEDERVKHFCKDKPDPRYKEICVQGENKKNDLLKKQDAYLAGVKNYKLICPNDNTARQGYFKTVNKTAPHYELARQKAEEEKNYIRPGIGVAMRFYDNPAVDSGPILALAGWVIDKFASRHYNYWQSKEALDQETQTAKEEISRDIEKLTANAILYEYYYDTEQNEMKNPQFAAAVQINSFEKLVKETKDKLNNYAK
jgi:hypothetical protein